MRDPSKYPAAMVICQSGVTAVYLVIGCVVYYYCGSYVSSPALSSAGALIKIISYAFAIPGLLATMTIVTHVRIQLIREIEAITNKRSLDPRFPQNSFSSTFSEAPDT